MVCGMAAASSAQQQITQLLVDWSSGDAAALDKLIPLVQPELHRLAHYYMSREKEGHTLQTALVIIKDHSRCSFAQFKLVAHLLDLRGLLFETCREGLNLLLLLRNRRLQLADCRILFLPVAVLLCDLATLFLPLFVRFEELVEQHRVHRFIADGIRYAFPIKGDQVRIHLRHLLSHEAKLWDLIRIKLLLVAEGYRLQRQDRFTRLVHRFDIVLVARGGSRRAEVTGGIDDNSDAS